MRIIVTIVSLVFLMGCANIVPTYDAKGNIKSIKSTKFLADLTFYEHIEYASDGKTIIKRDIYMETKTNADRILGEVVKGAGVLIDGAGKIMP